MTRGEEKATGRFWRPRFSLRTLVILGTLACAYFAAWEATKRHAATAVKYQVFQSGQEAVAIFEATSPAPLVIVQDEIVSDLDNAPVSNLDKKSLVQRNVRRFYVWLFGPMIRLPWESTWTQGPPKADDPFAF